MVTLDFSSQVEYRKDLENSKGHSINFCETPQFQNAAKVAKFTSDVSRQVHPQLDFKCWKKLLKTLGFRVFCLERTSTRKSTSAT